MSDYISKRDAGEELKENGINIPKDVPDTNVGNIEYVSRQYLLDEYDRQHQGPPGGARKIIAEAPAEDVVQVVRCRDCDCHGTCTHEQYLGMDGFCSHGERKNDVPTNIIESLKEEINTVNRLNDRTKNRGNNG